MKSQKIFTIDVELIERLQEEKNQSATVNELLKEYFSVAGTEEDEIRNSLKEADLAIIKANADKKLLEARIVKIEKAKEKLQLKYKHIPKEILDDFKHYPKMDAETLKVRFDGIYKRKYHLLEWQELIKAWRTWHGIR